MAETTTSIFLTQPIGEDKAPSPRGVWPGAKLENDSSQAVDVDLDAPWRTARGCGAPFTKNGSADTTSGNVKFTVEDPNAVHTWIRYGLGVEVEMYPIVVMCYRARNLASDGWYSLWLDDGTGSIGGGVVAFQLSELVADGELREIRKDLAAIKPGATFHGLAIGVKSGAVAPGVFQLESLSFQPAADQP